MGSPLTDLIGREVCVVTPSGKRICGVLISERQLERFSGGVFVLRSEDLVLAV